MASPMPMHGSKSRNVSMRMLSIAAALALSTLLLSASPASAGYGAIAWEQGTGKHGWSRNQATQQKADELALSYCGTTSCKVIVRMAKPELCAALATTKDLKTFGAASRKTLPDARLAALADCRKNNNGECVVRIGGCSK
jgi:Domain of unknown function (DUF4189)